MAKIEIQGEYSQAGEYLIHSTTNHVLHLQRNYSKPNKGHQKRPPFILVHISTTGHRTRLSGLFQVNSTISGCNNYSCDYGGYNYTLTLCESGATINRAAPKAKFMPLASTATSTSTTAGHTTASTASSNQLELW